MFDPDHIHHEPTTISSMSTSMCFVSPKVTANNSAQAVQPYVSDPKGFDHGRITYNGEIMLSSH